MIDVFIKVFNLSVQASVLILAVALMRKVMRRAPRWTVCIMWGIAAIRLLIPFSIESVLSLIPSAKTLPPEIIYSDTPSINSGIEIIDKVVNPVILENFAPVPSESVNPMQVVMTVLSCVWIVGVALMLLYGVISYMRLYIKVRPSVQYRDNIYYCDNIDTPFILGIIKPRIYMMSGMGDNNAEYVLKHEKAHIKRMDHVWKPLGFAILSVYWFNPIVWIGYVLFCRDIEKACDESVICQMDQRSRKEYSKALLECSMGKRFAFVCPLAFGEISVKDRIKSVLNYKKPTLWIIIASFAVILALAVCLLTNPALDGNDPNGDIPPIGDSTTTLPEDNTTKPPTDNTDYTELPTVTPVEPPDPNAYKSLFPYTETELNALKQRYPELFTLDKSKGLNLYIQEDYSCSYLCILRSTKDDDHSDTRFSADPVLSMRDVAVILEQYNISPENIHTYKSEISFTTSWIGFYSDPDFERKKGEVFLGLNVNAGGLYATHDTATFDIDGDGDKEYCVIGVGRLSSEGNPTFYLYAYNESRTKTEYYTVMRYGRDNLFFEKGEDGVTRIRNSSMFSSDQSVPDGKLYDIKIEGDNIYFLYDGIIQEKLVSW